MKISPTEMVVLSYLRNNARESLTKMSRATHIPVSTLFDKLKLYEKTIIRKHTCLVNFPSLGYELQVHMLIKLPKDRRSALQGFLLRSPRVNSAFRVNNGYDFLLEGIFKDMKEVEKFLEQLEEYDIKECKKLYILQDIKKEMFLTQPLKMKTG